MKHRLHSRASLTSLAGGKRTANTSGVQLFLSPSRWKTRHLIIGSICALQFCLMSFMLLGGTSLVHPSVYQSLELMVKLSPTPGPLLENLRVIWDYPGTSCTGFGVEATNFALALNKFLPNLKLMTEAPDICPGTPQEDAELYKVLREEDISSWSDIDIYVLHKPPHQYQSFPFEESHGSVTKLPRYLIGRSMSETLNVSKEWVENMNKMDEVWVPSQLGLEIFRENGVDVNKLHVVQEPLDCAVYVGDIPPLPLEGKGFRFASVFKWEPRKGPDVLLKAYFQEFRRHEPVTLYIKTFLMYEVNKNPYDLEGIMQEVNKVLKEVDVPHDQLPAVHILTGELRSDHLIRLYKSVDAYVQASRGEGWGLTISEAMAMGLPTIATSWGGQSEYMNKENSFQIPIEGFSHASGPCCFEDWQMWAEPSVTELRKIMRYVYEHRTEAKLVGQRGRRDVLFNYCRETVSQQVLKRFNDIAKKLGNQERASKLQTY